MEIITNNKLLATIAMAALQDVYDPEIGLNIIDLGLVYQIDFDEDAGKLYCTMTLTTQFCPMGESISTSVKEKLKQTFSNYEPEILLTFTPAWNRTMISEEGKNFLNR